jgi:hypothetical protein
MIDVKALAQEVERAKAARSEAEDACCIVEELLWELRQGPRAWRRLAEVDVEDEPPTRPH